MQGRTGGKSTGVEMGLSVGPCGPLRALLSMSHSV